MLIYIVKIFKGEQLVKDGIIKCENYAELNEMTFEVCNMGYLWSVDVQPYNEESLRAQEGFMKGHEYVRK